MTDADNNYEDWIKKIQEASGLKSEEKDVKNLSPKKEKENKEISMEKTSLISIIAPILVFLIAIIPRLFFLFFVSDPQNAGVGWYNDSYHHWQIAYLTKEIGLGQGFLRLWDLTGMEYFWGLLNPLLLVGAFTITGTADILVLRLLNVFLGTINIFLVFTLVRKHFNVQVALGAALLAIFNPVGIFTDTSGMQEPLGIMMLLLGIYFWPQKPLLTGFFWFLASMARSEYWLFSIGLIAALIFIEKKTDKKVIMAVSYFVLIFLYLKYLLDKTGNAIYPIYWNFLGNAAGEWQADIPLNLLQEQIRYIFIAILAICIVAILYIFIKKPRFYIFSLLGVGNFLFLSGFVGLSDYLKSYLPRFWVDRIFWFPYIWLGFMVALLFLYFMPKYIPKIGIILGWIFIIGILALSQYAWVLINFYSKDSKRILHSEMERGAQVSSVYKGGSILIPGGDPAFTYALYKSGIKGRDIRGQMFDPYFYIDEDPYQRWNKHRKTILNWFKKENIKLMIVDQSGERYKKLVERESDMFRNLDGFTYFQVYEVINDSDNNL